MNIELTNETSEIFMLLKLNIVNCVLCGSEHIILDEENKSYKCLKCFSSMHYPKKEFPNNIFFAFLMYKILRKELGRIPN